MEDVHRIVESLGDDPSLSYFGKLSFQGISSSCNEPNVT